MNRHVKCIACSFCLGVFAFGVLPVVAKPCTVRDNGTGTIDLPPGGCADLGPAAFHMIVDGLPAGTTIVVDASHENFLNPLVTPGGNLGGEVETFESTLELTLTGTGLLAGFSRSISMISPNTEVHTAPRNLGDPVQHFDTEMVLIDASIFGDPDFDLLRIRAGSGAGLLPSPGHTTLTRLPSGDFNVDRFFDITYQIEFVGAPDSILEGFGGTTTANLKLQGGEPATVQTRTGGPLDDCPPLPSGQDVFPSTAKLVVDLLNDGAEPFVLRLSSATLPDTIVQRAPQTGDTIPVEMLQLSLTGNHPRLGRVDVQLDPTQQSLGEIQNVKQDPTTCELVDADSFFDVNVEISLGQTLRGRRPLHLEASLIALPPRDIRYENPFLDPVNFFDPGSNTDEAQVLTHLHHVDPPLPPGGNDCFNTFLDANLNLPALGFFGPVQAAGPTTVLRSGPTSPGTGNCCNSGGACAGDADCPGTDTCCDFQQIDTELVQMELGGFDPLLGGLQIRQRPAPPSAGQVQTQQPDRTYVADSFFDVYIDFELTDQGVVLHNDVPIPVSAIGSSGLDGITNIPPDPQTRYESPPLQPFPLVLEDGTPVGDISSVVHVLDPPFDWQPPPPPDENCFDSGVHLEITIFNPFCQETVWLPGIFRVMRDAPADPGGIGQEIIETLMAKGLFSTDSACVGPVALRLSPDDATPSEGAVSSLTPEEFFPADSFFDVYVELDTGIGTLSAGPSHMTTTINALPPDDGEIYFGPGTAIPLFDDTGQQIGEILELEHEIHTSVECAGDCKATIMEFGLFEDDGSRAIVFNKNKMNVGIPKGGGGVRYDVVRGDLNTLRATGGAFVSGFCIQIDGGKFVADPAIPLWGSGFYYLARDGFKAYNGTWNATGAAGQVASRDPLLNPICPF